MLEVWLESVVSETVYKLLPAALVSADATFVNMDSVSQPLLSHLPAADVISAAQALISCLIAVLLHQIAPSLLAEQNSPLRSQDTCPVTRSVPLLGAQLEPPGREAGAIECLITCHAPASVIGPEASGQPECLKPFSLWDPILTEKQ